MSPKVHWVCFHGLFDFAYLLKLLSGDQYLPQDEYGFQDSLQLYFPNIYDVKVLSLPFEKMRGGLTKLSQELEVLKYFQII